MAQHATGLIPDPPDERDFNFKTIRRSVEKIAKKLPSSGTTFDLMSPVRDQLTIGSCTGETGVGFVESIGIEHLRDPFIPLSPLFLYYATRARSRQTRVDSGATIRATMKTLADTGTCPEELWPYNVSKFAQRPPKAAYADTKRFRIHHYWRVADLDELKWAIASRNPVAIGIQLYSSFEGKEAARTGIIRMPNMRREDLLGGHATLACAYDDAGGVDGRGHVKVKNSWGVDWGDKGYFYLPYDYFDPDLGLAMDMWTASV